MLLHHLKHNQVLHETVLLLTVTTEEIPRVSDTDHVHVEPRSLGLRRVVARYGFMNERSASMYSEIPPNPVVELGTRVEL